MARRYRLWLADAHEPTWQSAYVERSTVVDPRNFAALLHAAGPVASAYPVAGAFSYDESMVHFAALLAEALGLPGSPPETVLACGDKATTRRILTAAGVPQPRCRPVATARDAQRAAGAIGYPVVVKARGLAGSLGVVRADRPDDVAAALRAAATADYPGVPRYQDDVLVEEFLTGPEISIDAVVAGGECVPTIVARKSTGLEPFFEETGHTVDADDPLLHDAELRGQLQQIHEALGFVHGATHTEFKLTPAGPRLVRINARLGGDFIPYLGALATGTDPAVAAADVAAGIKPTTAPRHHRIAAIRFLYPEHDCEVEEVVVHRDRWGPSVHAAVATAGPGTRLALPPRGYMARYGHIIAVAEAAETVASDVGAGDVVELRPRQPAG